MSELLSKTDPVDSVIHFDEQFIPGEAEGDLLID